MRIDGFGLRYLRFLEETIVDGDGLRDALYLSGCRHACPRCHNPESWNGKAGRLVTDAVVDFFIERIALNPLLDGLTVTGGDPFYNPPALLELLRRIKGETGVDIWCYTGYRLEDMVGDAELLAPLQHIDTLVDGPFVYAERDPMLTFRGSRNQRLIRAPWDVAQRVLAGGEV